MPIPANIQDPIKHVRELHAHYCARFGQDIFYNMVRENLWKDWLGYCGWAWGKDEISMVIFYLREEIKRQKRNEGALKFSNLIGDPVKFEEDLALARKDRRASGSVRTPAPRPQAQATQGKPGGLTNSFGQAVESGPEAAASFAELLKKTRP